MDDVFQQDFMRLFEKNNLPFLLINPRDIAIPDFSTASYASLYFIFTHVLGIAWLARGLYYLVILLKVFIDFV